MTFSTSRADAPPAVLIIPEMKTVRLLNDEACRGNAGPGGRACILRFRDIQCVTMAGAHKR